MRWFWLDGLFATISLYFYSGFLGLFAVACGANNVQLGQLTAVASLCGVIALLPGAAAVELSGGRRKAVVIASGGIIARLPILIWVLVPFLLASLAGGGAAIPLTIAAYAVVTFGNNLGFPAWSAMAADIVPHSIRGRYFGHRSFGLNLAAMLTVPLAGWLIQAINRPSAPLGGYQVAFALALMTGLVATLAYSRIDDPQPDGGSRQPLRLTQLAGTLRRAPGFMPLVGCTLLWNLGVQICAPFMNVYLVHDLGSSMTMVGWITAAASLASILSSRQLGRLADTRGNTWMQGVTSLLIPFTPLLWMAARQPWHMLFINALGGLLWTGYNLASFNLVLEQAPEGARAEAVALFQFVIAASAVIGPMIGGYLADAHGYRLIMGISAGVRWAAALAFVWWVMRPAHSEWRIANGIWRRMHAERDGRQA